MGLRFRQLQVIFFLHLIAVSGLMRIWTQVLLQMNPFLVILTTGIVFHFNGLSVNHSLSIKNTPSFHKYRFGLFWMCKSTWYPSESKHSNDDPSWIYCQVRLIAFVILLLQWWPVTQHVCKGWRQYLHDVFVFCLFDLGTEILHIGTEIVKSF